MSKIIIGIHGLGNKPAAELTRKWWLAAMLEGFKKIGSRRSHIPFDLVYWANYIHPHPLDPEITDRNNPRFMEEPFTKADPNYQIRDSSNRKKILDYLEKQMDKLLLNDDLSINFAGISDLIIHHFFHDLEIYYTKKNNSSEDIGHAIRSKLYNALLKYKGSDIILIAHSMGSIIAYEVLHDLPPEIKINTFITIGSPLGMPVIISKIFHHLKPKHPHLQKLKVPENVIKKWVNLSDLSDRVAINYNLADDYAPNTLGVGVADVEVHNDYSINGKANPHKIYGYLRTPEVAQILLDFVEGDMNRLQKWLDMLYQMAIRLFKPRP